MHIISLHFVCVCESCPMCLEKAHVVWLPLSPGHALMSIHSRLVRLASVFALGPAPAHWAGQRLG